MVSPTKVKPPTGATPPSCLNCPSMLTPEESKVFFKKSIGVPVCARFGKPLRKIESTEPQAKAIAKSIAGNCSEFGNDRPATPNWENAKFQVMLPNPTTDVQTTPALVTSCQMCEYFQRDATVLETAGFSAGLCGRKGQLILATRHSYMARGCDEKSMGTPDQSIITGMYFLPEYEDDFLGAADPKLVREKNKRHLVDPNDYESDADVSAEDSSRGIRAWRRISDTDGTHSVLLPIYRNDYFDDEERKKIPQIGDDEHPEDYIDHFGGTYKLAALWMQLDETPAVWGESGTGKTELFRHLAWLMQLPFYRFSITGSTELDDLAGKMHFENGATVFKYGRLPLAWSKPSVIVIDEPNTGPPDVWQFLRPLTDNSKQLVLDVNEGESIDRGQDCYLGMAMNPAWDMRNIGANQIGDADANRMMHIAVELPSDFEEREIIKARCGHDGFDISDDQLDLVMRIAEEIRKLCDQGSLTMSWAIRPQIKVARALAWFDPITAYKMASADYLDKEQSKMVLAVVRAHTE